LDANSRRDIPCGEVIHSVHVQRMCSLQLQAKNAFIISIKHAKVRIPYVRLNIHRRVQVRGSPG